MLAQDIREDRENIIRITQCQNFFLRDSITLYFKHDDAELEALINIQLGWSFSKEQQIVKLFWNENCWVLCNSFFFHKKFQRRLLILQHLQKKTFFHVSCKLLFNFPNNRYLPNKVGTVLRTVWTEAKISLQGCLERTSGGRKKKNFFCKTMTQDTLPKKQRRSYLC